MREIGRRDDERSADQGRVCERLIRPSILSSTVGSSATVLINSRLFSAVTSCSYDGDAHATWTKAVTTVSLFSPINKCSTKCQCMSDITNFLSVQFLEYIVCFCCFNRSVFKPPLHSDPNLVLSPTSDNSHATKKEETSEGSTLDL